MTQIDDTMEYICIKMRLCNCGKNICGECLNDVLDDVDRQILEGKTGKQELERQIKIKMAELSRQTAHNPALIKEIMVLKRLYTFQSNGS